MFEQLVQAIVADPFDRRLRLVFADWLEEEGDRAWADYLRGALASDVEQDARQPSSWFRRITEDLASRHADRWQARWFGPDPLPAGWRVEWRGGVPEGVRTLGYMPTEEMLEELADWCGFGRIARVVLDLNARFNTEDLALLLRWQWPPAARSLTIDLHASMYSAWSSSLAMAATELASLRPWREVELRGLQLLGTGYGLDAWLAQPEIERISMHESGIDAIEWRRLRADSLGGKLRRFASRAGSISASAMRTVASVLAETELETLDLSSNCIGSEGAARLAERLASSRVQHLSLSYNAIGAGGLLAIASKLDRWPLASLEVVSNDIGGEIERFAQQNWTRLTPLGTLRRIDLARNRLRDAGAEAIARSTWLIGVEAVGLSSNDIGAPGLAALEAAPWLASVQRLDLNGNLASGTGLARFLQAAELSNLRELNLRRNQLGPADAIELAGAQQLEQLVALMLGQNEITARGAAALAGADHLLRLRYLDLRVNPIGDQGARAMADARWRNLELLNLNSAHIGDGGLLALGRSPALCTLKQLDLTSNTFSPAGFAAFCESARLDQLGNLAIGYCGLDDPMLAALVGSPLWPRLYELDLSQAKLTVDGFELLARASAQSDLRCLRLDQVPLDARSVAALVEHSAWPRLETLYVRGDARDPGLIAALRQRFRTVIGGDYGPASG